jgi:hypothetical protein
MNYITEHIMKLLKVDQTQALKIQNHMDYMFEMNYSECSTRTLNNCIRGAAKQLECLHEFDTTMIESPMCIYCGAPPSKADLKAAGYGD